MVKSQPPNQASAGTESGLFWRLAHIRTVVRPVNGAGRWWSVTRCSVVFTGLQSGETWKEMVLIKRLQHYSRGRHIHMSSFIGRLIPAFPYISLSLSLCASHFLCSSPGLFPSEAAVRAILLSICLAAFHSIYRLFTFSPICLYLDIYPPSFLFVCLQSLFWSLSRWQTAPKTADRENLRLSFLQCFNVIPQTLPLKSCQKTPRRSESLTRLKHTHTHIRYTLLSYQWKRSCKIGCFEWKRRPFWGINRP